MSRRIVKDVEVDAPVEEVWQALSTPEGLTRWFPPEARVVPGTGGSIWISWGEGAGGEAPITAWEPGRHLQWTETHGPRTLIVDFHIEARGGRTVVRLVHSGFGDEGDFDAEFHMVEGGWAYFMANLQHALTRHRGRPRDLLGFREPSSLSRTEAFDRLVAAVADVKTKPIARSPATQQLGLLIPTLDDALLFIEIEPAERGVRAGFWLSTYGLPRERWLQVQQEWTTRYRRALGIQ